MKISTVTTITGKIHTALKNRGDAQKPNYSVGLTTMERYYDRKQQKAIQVPTTVFVNIIGDVPDFLKEYLSKEGNAITVVNATDFECRLATDKEGKPLVYNKGERQGEYMYNMSVRAVSNAFDLPPRETPQGTQVNTVTKPAETPAPVPVKADQDDNAWLK